jgi:hypothetical protein
MQTKTWRVALWFPTWAATFEAFCSALHHAKTRPSDAALKAALAALEAAHKRDWLYSFACAAQAHALQPDGIWLPLLATTQSRLWWYRLWSPTVMTTAIPTRRADVLSGD